MPVMLKGLMLRSKNTPTNDFVGVCKVDQVFQSIFNRNYLVSEQQKHKTVTSNTRGTLPASSSEVRVAMRPITVRSPVHTAIPCAVPGKRVYHKDAM